MLLTQAVISRPVSIRVGLDAAEALERKKSRDLYFGGAPDSPQTPASLQTFNAQDAFSYDYDSDDKEDDYAADQHGNVSFQASALMQLFPSVICCLSAACTSCRFPTFVCCACCCEGTLDLVDVKSCHIQLSTCVQWHAENAI